MALIYLPGVDEAKFTDRFRAILANMAGVGANHRYGWDLIVTSGWRESGGGSHPLGEGADLRGRVTPNDPPAMRRKVQLFWACLFTETVTRLGPDLGIPAGHWAVGVYDDDDHVHVDLRPHSTLERAVWYGRG